MIYISKEEEAQEKKVIPEIKLPKKQKIVYETIYNNPGLRISGLVQICKLSEDVVYTAIKSLKTKNIVNFDGSNKDGGYYVNLSNEITE